MEAEAGPKKGHIPGLTNVKATGGTTLKGPWTLSSQKAPLSSPLYCKAEKAEAPGQRYLGLSPNFATEELCDAEQVTVPLWASASSGGDTNSCLSWGW